MCCFLQVALYRRCGAAGGKGWAGPLSLRCGHADTAGRHGQLCCGCVSGKTEPAILPVPTFGADCEKYLPIMYCYGDDKWWLTLWGSQILSYLSNYSYGVTEIFSKLSGIVPCCLSCSLITWKALEKDIFCKNHFHHSEIWNVFRWTLLAIGLIHLSTRMPNSEIKQSVLMHSDCCNRIDWVVTYFTVLEAGGCRIKALAGLVSAEDLLPGLTGGHLLSVSSQS